MNRKSVILIGGACMVAACCVPRAQAALADLEAAQQANANLVFQYGFEGVDDTTRLADGSVNGYGLQRVAGGSGGDVNDIQFIPGYEAGSQAYQPSSQPGGNYRIGAGLNTISTAVPLNADLTIEVVLQLDGLLACTNDSGAISFPYVVSGRPSGKQRAYFLRQVDTNRVVSTMGDTFGDQVSVLNPYNAGDWYYLSMTASYNSGDGITTVNYYGANLTANETTLSLLGSDNSLFTGDWTGNSQVGIGNFLNGSQEFLQGRIDSIALTGEVLDSSALQSRLDALVIPEPSTMALLTIGVGGILVGARRRFRR